jgi:serine/threonine protein kinase
MTLLGQTIANHKIIAKLGEGGMGEVYKGVDLMLEREVAIKALHPELARRADIVERFRKEAMILARLNHRNIATLYGLFKEGESLFMVMEFAPGKTLDKLIARQRHGMAWRLAVSIACQTLKALDHAHGQGVVHRDLKPANIMVSAQSEVKVMDFGIARVMGGTSLTRISDLVGTPAYMSPEQVLGQDSDARSDLYSLGLVLYEMLTGQPPFAAPSEYDLLKAQVESPPPPFRDRLPQIPEIVERAVLRVLEKNPDARFQSARDFRLALEQSLTSPVPAQKTLIMEAPAALRAGKGDGAQPKPATGRNGEAVRHSGAKDESAPSSAARKGAPPARPHSAGGDASPAEMPETRGWGRITAVAGAVAGLSIALLLWLNEGGLDLPTKPSLPGEATPSPAKETPPARTGTAPAASLGEAPPPPVKETPPVRTGTAPAPSPSETPLSPAAETPPASVSETPLSPAAETPQQPPAAPPPAEREIAAGENPEITDQGSGTETPDAAGQSAKPQAKPSERSGSRRPRRDNTLSKQQQHWQKLF